MERERFLRAALWVAAGANVAGASLFAFPASWPAQLVAFPAPVPVLYRAFTAMFVLLFAGAYVYLASAPAINRPFVAFAAIGKTCAFLAMAGLWLGGHASAAGVGLFGADLALAGAFAWGLGGRTTA